MSNNSRFTESSLTLTNSKLFTFALLLAVSGLWFTPFPPMVDLPQHVAQITALQEISAGNTTFTETYLINWFTPYIVGYLLLYLLALVMPVVIAAKLLVSAVLISIPLLTGVLLREAGADERWRWLVIPSIFSLAFSWGFLPYLVAIPVGLYLLILTIRFGRQPTLRGGILLAFVAIVSFFCHIIVMGFCCLLALLWHAGGYYRQPLEVLRRWLPYTAPVPLVLLWLQRTSASEAYVQGAAIGFGSVLDRFKVLLIQPAGIESFLLPLSLVISVFIFAYPVLSGARLSKAPQRWLPVIGGFAAFFLLPERAAGAILIFHRLDIFLVPLWLLLWEYPAGKKPGYAWVAMLVVLLPLAINVLRFAGYAQESRGFSTLLAQMEPRKNLLYAPAFPRSLHFSSPIYLHYGAWYAATKQGISDFSFAFFYPSMVRYQEGRHAWIKDDGFSWDPMQFNWASHNGEFYDYFLIYSPEDMTAAFFKEQQDQVELTARDGWWWLYEKRNPAQP